MSIRCLFVFILVLRGNNVAVHSIDSRCPCGQLVPRPDLWKKALTARWMVHSLDWGVLVTMSRRITGKFNSPIPFGNVYSFVDGNCANASGTPYFYGTDMDQSLQDMKANPSASLTLSEASLPLACADSSATDYVQAACSITPQYIGNNTDEFPGDPENPVCARLTLSGTLVEIDDTTEEYTFAVNAFFERHPQMEFWPSDHKWKIVKLDVTDVWLIDYFGGATILSPEQYYEHDLMKLAVDGY